METDQGLTAGGSGADGGLFSSEGTSQGDADNLFTADSPSGEGNRQSEGSEGTPEVTKRSESEWHGYEKQFSPEYKGHPAFKDLDSPDKLAKSYIELNGKIGKSLVPPGKNATEEERYDFMRRAGIPTRPKSQDEYVFSDPDGVGKQDLSWFRDTAFRYGLSNGTADAIQRDFRVTQQRAENDRIRANAAAEDTLRTQMGSAAYTKLNELASRGANVFLRDEKKAHLAEFIKGLPASVRTDVRFKQLMAEMGGAVQESSRVPRTDAQDPSSTGGEGKAFAHLDKV